MDLKYFSKEALEPFLDGEKFIMSHFGKDAEKILKFTDVPTVIKATKKLLNYNLFEKKIISISEIQSYIIKGYPVLVLIDHNKIIRKQDLYQGHFVAITGFDAENVYYHESGPVNAEPNKKVEKSFWQKKAKIILFLFLSDNFINLIFFIFLMFAISIKNLQKSYNGKAAVKGISIDIEKGEFFGLLGPNGAGKTTTIGILTGLINKTEGDVKILGYDLEKDYRIIRKSIGLVPQEFNFDPFFSLYDLLVYQAGYFGIASKEAKIKAESLLREFDLWDSRKLTMRQISGGMKRRLLIAKALIHDPEILILDEPTAGVDVELRKKLWQMLQDLNNKGKTIILTTHYLEEAEALCKRIAIIDNGEIIEIDTKKNLMNKFRQDEIIIQLKKTVHDRLLEEVRTLMKNKNYKQYTLNDHKLTIITADAGKEMPQIIESIGSNHIEFVDLKQRNLEDIFLRLTNDNKKAI